MCISVPPRLKAGYDDWLKKLNTLYKKREIGGVEKFVVLAIHFLHITTISGWIKIILDPISDNPTVEDRRRRDRTIEFYVVFELVALQLLLWWPGGFVISRCVIAIYVLYEIFLNLSSIVFVGKFDVYPPTVSIERSLLLFGFNAIQVITIFAIFYWVYFDFSPYMAFIEATLVFGTVGHPLGNDLAGGELVALQIMADFVLLAVFLGAFVGSLSAFKRRRPDAATLYIALIHKDADSAYGVSFPDVPGVFTAGDSIDRAMLMAAAVLKCAAEDWSNLSGDKFPVPRTIDELRADADFRQRSADAVVVAVPFRPNIEAVA
jgi:antitoxin HicB